MKKTKNLLAAGILFGMIFSILMACSNQKDQIIGKWELKELISTDSIQDGWDSLVYKEVIGLLFEFKKDGIMKPELSKKQAENAALTSWPDKYYMVNEGGKDFIVQIEKGEETKFEIIELNSETLHIKSKNSILKLVCIK